MHRKAAAPSIADHLWTPLHEHNIAYARSQRSDTSPGSPSCARLCLQAVLETLTLHTDLLGNLQVPGAGCSDASRWPTIPT